MSMTPASDLVGRACDAHDRADPRRIAAYRRLLGLADGEPVLAFHWLLFGDIPTETRADGHAATMPPLPPLPWPRRMWAGGETRWIAPIVPDEPLIRHTTVTRADPKSGATGDFLLTSLSHRIMAGAVARIEERQDIVFLPAATALGPAAPRSPDFEPDWSEPRRFGPVDLFRYSALTLNGHRIHYDEPYAREVERYPGLVVHGPLLATHLLHAAARRTRSSPATFTHRAVAPVFASETVHLAGSSDGARLAVIGEDGGVRMTATMTFVSGA